jgi:hypothetical protein
MTRDAWFRFGCFLAVLAGAITTLGCGVPGHQLDGGGGNGQGTPCMVPAQYEKLTAPIIDSGDFLLPPNPPLAVGTTVSVLIGSPYVVQSAIGSGGIEAKVGGACVADGSTATALPVDITASAVGVWPLRLDTGAVLDVDVRQPVDVTFVAAASGKEIGQVALGGHVLIAAYLVDRSGTKLYSPNGWKWAVASGKVKGLVASDASSTSSTVSNLQGLEPISAGPFQITATSLGISRTITLTVVQ